MTSEFLDWILILPLYHLLDVGQEPYKEVVMTSDSTSDVWWGVQQLSRETLQRYAQTEQSFEE